MSVDRYWLHDRTGPEYVLASNYDAKERECERLRDENKILREKLVHAYLRDHIDAALAGSKPMLDLTPIGPGRTVDDALTEQPCS